MYVQQFRKLVKNSWQTPEQLAHWLHRRGVDCRRWNQGHKSVSDLWMEIETGICQLGTRPLQRQLKVVSLLIVQDDKLLLESGQMLQDGSYRIRNTVPSEKVAANESLLAAVYRCVDEELNIPANAASMVPFFLQREHRLSDSKSYPGLSALYEFHYFFVRLPDLPRTAFSNRNLAPAGTDPVQHHFWNWVPLSQVTCVPATILEQLTCLRFNDMEFNHVISNRTAFS